MGTGKRLGHLCDDLVAGESKGGSNILFYTNGSNTVNMVDRAVVNHKNTACSRVWVHFLKKALYECKECIAVECTNLDATVDDTIKCQSRQHQKPVLKHQTTEKID